MADKSLNVRIQNKFDSYENWMSSNLILKAGEFAIASIPSGDATGLTPPAIGVKVGDGSKKFSELAWIQATAGDVYSWAKAATKPTYAASEITGLTEFVEGISDIDTNTTYSFELADNYKVVIKKKEIGEDAFSAYTTIDLTNAFNAKADKVSGAVEGNFAGLDANGNLTDSGKKASDFATAAQGAKADSAVQSVVEGATNGTISVDGTEVNVHGLGSAAYTDSSAYATAGHNHDSAYAAKAPTESHISNSDIHVTTEDKAKWNAAEQNAKDYADGKVASVTAGDESVTIGGTATAPTVAAKISKDAGNALELAADGLKVTIPTAAEYSVVKDSNSGDFAAVYHLTKDGANVGAAINIPKDMVVKSGSVVTNPVGQPLGTYIELVLQNVTDPLYINVGSLIEYVTGSTAEDGIITVNVDPDTHVVEATIYDGSIPLTKLDSNVQTEINKAHDHANKTVLDGITAEKVAVWDAAQPNVIESISGVAGTLTGKDFKVTGVSTDLLNQGTDTLIFNCGTSAE